MTNEAVKGWTWRGRFPSRQCSAKELEVRAVEDNRLEVVNATEHNVNSIGRRPTVGVDVIQVGKENVHP